MDVKAMTLSALRKEFEFAYNMATTGGDPEWLPILNSLQDELDRR